MAARKVVMGARMGPNLPPRKDPRVDSPEPFPAVVPGPDPIPSFRPSRLPHVSNRVKKWITVACGCVLIVVTTYVAVIEALRRIQPKPEVTQKELEEVRKEIATLKRYDNTIIVAGESLRRHWGADRKANVEGEVIADGIDQDTLRVRSESFCSPNSPPNCRPSWSFSGEGRVRPMPKPHPGVEPLPELR